MEFFLTWILPIMLGLTLGWLLLGRKKVNMQYINLLDEQAFKNNMRKGQLVDVRKKDRYDNNKIKGARNFNPRYLKSKHQTKIRKDQPLYLYCDNGQKSLKTAKALSKKGFKEINVLKGGLKKHKTAQS